MQINVSELKTMGVSYYNEPMDLRMEQIRKGSSAAAETKELFEAAFPPHELMPFWFLFWRTKLDCVDFLAFYDEDVFVGASYIITNEDLSMIFYLAIDGTHRSKGYGSAVLEAICARYPGNRVSLDIEVLDPTAKNYDQRVRRKAFYEKNNFKSSGLLLDDKGDKYEILVRGGSVTAQDYYDLYRRYTGPFFFWRFGPKVVEL